MEAKVNLDSAYEPYLASYILSLPRSATWRGWKKNAITGILSEIRTSTKALKQDTMTGAVLKDAQQVPVVNVQKAHKIYIRQFHKAISVNQVAWGRSAGFSTYHYTVDKGKSSKPAPATPLPTCVHWYSTYRGFTEGYALSS